jgi:hypothetical protein
VVGEMGSGADRVLLDSSGDEITPVETSHSAVP